MALSSKTAAELRADHEARKAERASQLAATVAEHENAIAAARSAASAADAADDRQLADELRTRKTACCKVAMHRLTPLAADFIIDPTRKKARGFAEAVRALDHAFSHELGCGLSPRLITFAVARAISRNCPQVITHLARRELTSLGIGDPRADVLRLEDMLKRAIASNEARAIYEALDDLATVLRKQAGVELPSDDDRELFNAKCHGDRTVIEKHAERQREATAATAREAGRIAKAHAERERWGDAR